MRGGWRITILAALCFLAVVTGGARALDCMDPDQLVLIWENGELSYDPPLFTVVTGTFYISHPTVACECVSGYEFKVNYPSGVDLIFLNYTMRGTAINVGTWPELIVGLASPLFVDENDMIPIVDVQFLVIGSGQSDFSVEPVSIPTMPGEIVYADGDDYGHIVPMEPVSGGFGVPMANIYGPDLPYCTFEYDLAVGITAAGDANNLAGTAVGATDGYDPDFDLPVASAADSVFFPHPEWDAPVGDNFNTDIRAIYDPLTEVGHWNFVVEIWNPQSFSTTVDVDFSPNFTSGDGIGLYLTDHETGEVADLFPSLQYSYLAPPGPSTREFTLHVGDFAPPVYDWDIVWGAQIMGLSDASNTAGVTTGASDGYDPALDIPEPPAPPMNYVSAFFRHPDWPFGGRFATDVRALYDPLLETKVWPLAVETDQSGTLRLDFAPSFDAATGWGLMLRDLQNGALVDLWGGLDYEFAAGPGTYEFELIVGSVPAENLMLGITATTGGYTDTGNFAVTDTSGTDGYDPGLDIPEPPAPPVNYVSAFFPHPGWPLGDRYRVDTREVFDPLMESKTWLFTVESDQSGTMTLDFAPNFDAASGIPLQLRDLSTGVVHDLFPSLTYQYAIGSGMRSFEIIVGGALEPPPLDPTARTVPAGWSLIGFPLQPPPGGATLDAVVYDDLVGLGYAYSYEGASGYAMADGGAPAMPGEGYWLATDEPFAWTMEGDRRLDPVVMDLRDGWNLSGYPLWFTGDLDAVRVVRLGESFTWDAAVAEGIVSASVYGYDSVADSYVMVGELDAWHGYWVAALVPGVSLVFDWQDIYADAKDPETGTPDTTPFTWDRWRLAVNLDDHLDHTTAVTFGVEPGASDGFDAALDYPQPPASPAGPRTRFAFPHPEWDLKVADDFLSDVIAPSKDPQSWRAVVTRPEPGPVTLSWDASAWPPELDLQVYLPEQNRVVVLSMRDQDEVTLNVDGSLAVVFRTPDMTTGVPAVDVTRYEISNAPNPFNPQTQIHFAMPTAGEAEIRIFDMRGRMVRRLVAGPLPAGRHEVKWLGRDDSGRGVSSGTYLSVLYVNGRNVGRVAKMSLIR